MNFHSFEYGAFLCVVALGFWLALRSRTARHTLLLCASYFFYAGFDWRFLGLIAFSTFLDYRVGQVLSSSDTPSVRRAALAVSITLNIGLLATFKYFNWIVSVASQVSGFEGLPELVGKASLQIPIGISFYTFQTLSYSIDLYRRELKPARSLSEFALFVAFFPQLVAGPIVRASEFLPQLERRPTLTAQRLKEGLFRISCGLTKKVLIADVMYRDLVAPYFTDVVAHTGVTHWLLAIVCIVRTYYDFSGYCDIAIGSAKILGFDLPENFRTPFRALTVREFWQRWHITLYTWLRDYLFQPLVGPRLAEPRLTCALFLTIVLIGVWHGPTFFFLAFGVVHGTAVVVEWRFQMWHRKRYRRAFASTRLRRAVLWLYATQFCAITSICIHHVELGLVVEALSNPWGAKGLASFAISGWLVASVACVLHFLPDGIYKRMRMTYLALPTSVAGAILGGIIGASAYLRLGEVPFVYFQF